MVYFTNENKLGNECNLITIGNDTNTVNKNSMLKKL